MRIVLACGGSGGHIFPAFSVAEELTRRDPAADIIYICGHRDIEDAIFRIVDKKTVFAIDSAPFRGGRSFVDPVFLFRIARGYFSALALFIQKRPGIVVGFGGHTSFPAICAAKTLGIRTMLHEQNAAPGRANRLMARLVDRVALSYAESANVFANCRAVRLTGNPIRRSIETAERREALAFFGFDPARKTVLVLGGSQGAESINKLFLTGLSLMDPMLKAELQVLHLCGKMPPERSEAVLKAEGVPGRAYSFFERMDLAYAAADAAIGRAGATFLAEIAYVRLPAVLVPYPFAGAHQLENAKAFARDHRAVVIEQSEADPGKIAAELSRLLTASPEAGARPPRPGEAREKLADYILETK